MYNLSSGITRRSWARSFSPFIGVAILLCAVSSHASPVGTGNVWKTGTICVEIDGPEAEDLAGDYWTSHAPRRANGVEYQIVHEGGSIESNFNAKGCDVVEVLVPALRGFDLTIFSNASVNGVELESWRGTEKNKDPAEVTVQVKTGPETNFSKDTVTIPILGKDQVWFNLQVAIEVFKVHDWNVKQAVSRGCCTNNKALGYNLDGTCTNPDYQLLTTPIQLQTLSAGSCCGSSLVDASGDSTGVPGVQTKENNPYKFIVAHELGHVIAKMRMGGAEQYKQDVTMNGCAGDFDGNKVPVFRWKRGSFTKELLGEALREGWGNFVSAVTWNDRRENACQYQVVYMGGHDFDLNGNGAGSGIDNAGTIPGPLHAAMDCEGIPTLNGHGAIAAWVTGDNWLKNAEDEPSNSCVAAAPHLENNRSTIYDVLRFFWDLTTDRNITPNTLSDLYVNMCPREWALEDKPNIQQSFYSDTPRTRILISADWGSIMDAVLDEYHQITQ